MCSYERCLDVQGLCHYSRTTSRMAILDGDWWLNKVVPTKVVPIYIFKNHFFKNSNSSQILFKFLKLWCDRGSFFSKITDHDLIWLGITFYDDLIEKPDHFPDHFSSILHCLKSPFANNFEIIFKKVSRIT